MQLEGRYRDDLVSPALRGRYTRKSNFLRRHWTKRLERLGIPQIHLHALRHFHASVLIDAGQNIKIMQQRLGHADLETTLSIYAKLLDPSQRAAANAVQKPAV